MSALNLSQLSGLSTKKTKKIAKSPGKRLPKEMPFFGHAEVGEEIAKLLTSDNNFKQLKNNLWAAYKQDGERHWLENNALILDYLKMFPWEKRFPREFQRVFFLERTQ